MSKIQAVITSIDCTIATGGKQALRYIHAINLAENKASNTVTGPCTSTDVVKVFLRDGSSAGAILMDIRIANYFESKEIVFDKPLFFPNGVYVSVPQGSVRGGIHGT